MTIAAGQVTKGSRQEGQYPEWFKGRKDSYTSNTIKMATKTPIVWAYSSVSKPDMWISDLSVTVHVSSNSDGFTSSENMMQNMMHAETSRH